jgi:hypothetical protein
MVMPTIKLVTSQAKCINQYKNLRVKVLNAVPIYTLIATALNEILFQNMPV